MKALVDRRTGKVDCYRHHALEPQFSRFGGQWYLQITPTYRFTEDGVRLHRFYEARLSGLKALEHNASVLGQVAMWSDILLGVRTGLFAGSDYPYLRFEPPLQAAIDVSIDDKAWLSTEDSATVSPDPSAADVDSLFDGSPETTQ